jgi:hypothetical protein
MERAATVRKNLSGDRFGEVRAPGESALTGGGNGGIRELLRSVSSEQYILLPHVSALHHRPTDQGGAQLRPAIVRCVLNNQEELESWLR